MQGLGSSVDFRFRVRGWGGRFRGKGLGIRGFRVGGLGGKV